MRRAWRLSPAVFAVSLLAVLTAACTSGHSVLGTTASPCFKALPAATSAVQHRGTLVGVRRVGADHLARLDAFKKSPLQPRLAGLRRQPVCTVAFRGSFGPGQVDHAADPSRSGPVVIVLVGSVHDDVVGALVLRYLPFSFLHSHL